MAFETSNLQSAMVAGPIKIMCGDWSGSAGDASGTITLGGGNVYFQQFTNQDSDNPKEYPQVDVSYSGSTITMTVHNHMNVTNGRFFIVYS